MELKCHTVCSHGCFLDVLKTSNPLYRWNKQPAYELKARHADLLTSRLEGYSYLSKNFSNGWPKDCSSCPGGVKKMVCDLLPHQKLVTCGKLDDSSAVLFKHIWHPGLQRFWALGWEDCLRQMHAYSNLNSESSLALEALQCSGSHEEQILMIYYG